MKYTTLYLSILAMIVIPLASADFNGAKQGTQVNITHSVRLDGFPVSNALCNITVLNPDRNILVAYQQMTYNSTAQIFNYTLLENQTQILGDYCYDVTCTASGQNQTSTFCFPVTPSGKEYSLQESITYMFILILSIGLFVLCFLWWKNMDGSNVTNEEGRIVKINFKKYLKSFLGILCYLIIVWITYVGWILGDAYLHIEAVGKFLFWIHYMTLVAIYPIALLYIIFAIITYIRDLKLDKLVQRGIFPKGLPK